MPEQHALLGPSSADRWIACPGSMCLTRPFPDTSSVYADEGTLAHSIAELRARKRYTTDIKPSEYEEQLKLLQQDPLYDPEMMECTDAYLELIDSILSEHKNPTVLLEQQLEYGTYVRDGFGTGDCVIYSENRADVVDYKHGKGVLVDIKGNPQLKTYGVAAALMYLSGGAQVTATVGTHVCQPRNGGNSSCLYMAGELMQWAGDVLRPAGELAYECYDTPQDALPEDMLRAGKHCKFCKAKAVCKARGKAVAVEVFGKKEAHTYSDKELHDILSRAKGYTEWVADIQEHCLKRALEGKPVPGYKLVNGRGSRVFKDPELAFGALQLHGFDVEDFYERKPLSVAKAEKLVGAKVFKSLDGILYETKPGAPTLVPDDDPRKEFSRAEVFFE